MPFDLQSLLTYAWGGVGWNDAFSRLMRIEAGDIRDASTVQQFIEQHILPKGFSKFEGIEIYNLMVRLMRTRRRPPPQRLGREARRGGRTRRTAPKRPQVTSRTSGSRSRINMAGNFQMLDETGEKVVYRKGDIVYYEGRSYIATSSTSGFVPESTHPDNRWRPIDNPENAIDGDTF
jgi:hypothetical protein